MSWCCNWLRLGNAGMRWMYFACGTDVNLWGPKDRVWKTEKWHPKRYPHPPYPNPWNLWILPYMSKKGGVIFVDVIKLRILRWDNYPGLSGSALNAITCLYKRGRERCDKHREDVQREIWRCWPWKLKRHCLKTRNASSHQKLEEARNRLSPKASGRAAALLLTPWFQPSETGFRHLTFRTIRE